MLKLKKQSVALDKPSLKLARQKTKRQQEREAAEKANDPLGEIEYTGDGETDSLAEMSAIQKSFRERSKDEQKRFQDATDSEYWVAVCFQSRKQKEEFLQKLNLLDLGDKYMDGMKVADRLNVELVSDVPAMPKIKAHRGQFKKLIREV